MFGRMKSIFGVRRTHLRGKQPVENELGILLMIMNLTKLTGILTKVAANFPREQLANVKKEKNRPEILLVLEFQVDFSLAC
jgi:hypothetical protein